MLGTKPLREFYFKLQSCTDSKWKAVTGPLLQTLNEELGICKILSFVVIFR